MKKNSPTPSALNRYGFGKDLGRFAGGPSRFRPKTAGPRFPSGRTAPVFLKASAIRAHGGWGITFNRIELKFSNTDSEGHGRGAFERRRDRCPIAEKNFLLFRDNLPLPDGNQRSRRLPSEADTLIFPLPFKSHSQSARPVLFSHPSVTEVEAPSAFSPQHLSAERPGRQGEGCLA